MRTYVKYCLFLFLLLLLNAAITNAQNYQKEFNELKQYHKLQLADTLYDYRFTVIAVSEEKPDLEKTYTWYINNTIQVTQGNYSGKLLHGTYIKYYRKTKQLAEKGEYKYGLKEGIWQQWNSDGTFFSNVTYTKGVKEGMAQFYDTAGNIVEKCYFKGNVKHGKCYSYINGEEQKVVKYKNGTVEENKARKRESAKTRKDNGEKETKEKKTFFSKLIGKTENSGTEQPKKVKARKGKGSKETITKEKSLFLKNIFKKKKEAQRSESTKGA